MTGSPRDEFRRSLSDSAEPPGVDWSMTFADTMSLLMGFFVLLISFSTFDETRFQRIAGGVQAVFGGVTPRPQPDRPAAAPGGEPGRTPAQAAAPDDPRELHGALEAWDRQTEGAMALRAFPSYRGVEAEVPLDRVFEPESDRPTTHAEGLARFVAAELHRTARSRRLVVVVPIEATPPKAPQFEDAWALAMARAQALTRLVSALGPADAARIVPAAGGRPDARVPGVTLLFERPEVRPR